MDWGYYCRTCGASSDPLFKEPNALFDAFREIQRDYPLDPDDTIATDSLDLQALLFLANHLHHDIWAECEVGVLSFSTRAKPFRGSALPERFRRSINASVASS